jgi:hypothetical protein
VRRAEFGRTNTPRPIATPAAVYYVVKGEGLTIIDGTQPYLAQRRHHRITALALHECQ